MGFLWVHVESFLHSVASPLHSFVVVCNYRYCAQPRRMLFDRPHVFDCSSGQPRLSLMRIELRAPHCMGRDIATPSKGHSAHTMLPPSVSAGCHAGVGIFGHGWARTAVYVRAGHRDSHTRPDSAQTQHTTSTATKSTPYTRLITTSALALQSQHRDANLAPAR